MWYGWFGRLLAGSIARCEAFSQPFDTGVKAGCADCHGPEGRGDGPSVPTLRRDGGLPIRPRPFAGGRFLRGGSLADLHLTLATGLDGFFKQLSGENLEALLAQELGPTHRLDAFSASNSDERPGRDCISLISP